ncbi:OB-fold-containig protein [Pararhodobacter zhoushanensis]|uniref:OB-fold-containig protein n=1 Tax=Pararhodobacter zhoushanensis TaxID=2479545 RepID=UPI000F8D046C|nr:OB-fold-containig protein [Pararhodobacter zhoushanensis]
MLEFLLSGSLAPFSVALALLVGLLALELALSLVGGSIFAGGAELDAPELDLPDLDAPDLSPDGFGHGEPADVSGVSSVLGLGKTPFMIWLASALLGFGVSGVLLQSVLLSTLGSALPGWLAAIPALVAGGAFARGFGGFFARLIPQDETQSVSEATLGRRRGVITQGTAERGRPAEVRVTDRHGNPHYLRAEPLEDGARLVQGSTVLVLRDHRLGLYRLLPVE